LLRHAELIRVLEAVPGFPRPHPDLEQVLTPSEAAALLLEEAFRRGDLFGRSVLDLGAGTGRLAIGAARLGARSVYAVETDADAVGIGRAAARAAGVRVSWRVADVTTARRRVDTVIMNPPFGAQRRGADRPFWERAHALAGSAVYAFALADSRTFIARSAVERGAHVESNRAVPWDLVRTFAHHRHAKVRLSVDLWTFRRSSKR
ncbi:MAG: METTL5 family protein, partial [Thermoplasmata archaeon]